MRIQIERTDPLAGIPDSHNSCILSRDVYESWSDALAALQSRGLPITEDHMSEFAAHPDTQFKWSEFVQCLGNSYLCEVAYDVRIL